MTSAFHRLAPHAIINSLIASFTVLIVWPPSVMANDKPRLAIIVPGNRAISNNLNQLANRIAQNYSNQGIICDVISEREVKGHLEHEHSSWDSAIPRARHLAFAMSAGYDLVGSINTTTLKDNHETLVLLWACNLLALTHGEYNTPSEQVPTLLPFDDHPIPHDRIALHVKKVDLQEPIEYELRCLRRLMGARIQNHRIDPLSETSIGYSCGLRGGDIIKAIDGVGTKNERIPVLFARFRGQPNIALDIERGTESVSVNLVLPRPTLEWEKSFLCLGKQLDQISQSPERNRMRSEWLGALKKDTRLVLLSLTEAVRRPELLDSLPLMNAIVSNYGKKGLEWIVVSGEMERKETVSRLKQNRFDAIIAIDLLLRRELSALPNAHFLMDRTGKLLYVNLRDNEVSSLIDLLLNKGD